MWEVPIETNGKLTSYDIFYTYNNSLLDSKWMVETKHLGLVGSFKKEMYTRLIGIKENRTFYLKIRAENKEGYGPFCNTVTIQPPIAIPRVFPNITYTVLSHEKVLLSWDCPRVLDAFVASFTILFTSKEGHPEDKWKTRAIVPGSSKRFADVVKYTMPVEEGKIFIKVRAEYDDQIPGKWSNIIKIYTKKQGKIITFCYKYINYCSHIPTLYFFPLPTFTSPQFPFDLQCTWKDT